MLKNNLLFFFLAVSNGFFSQNQFTIENNAENVAVFDTGNPNSFMSFLEFNSSHLKENYTKGIDRETYHSLSSEDKKSICAIIGNAGIVPLIDENPNSPNFGKNLLFIDENGFGNYVYDAPDTIRTDFAGISRISFEYTDGKGSVWERIEKVKLWKRYGGQIYEVLSLDAQEFFNFESFSRMYPLELELSNRLTNLSDSMSLWNFLRDAALLELEMDIQGKKIQKSRDLKMHIFPSGALGLGYYHSIAGLRYLEQKPWLGGYYAYHNGDYFIDQKPISLELGEYVFKDSTDLDEVYKLFDKVHLRIITPTMPLMNVDPNSPNFGELLEVINEKGEREFVYDEPWPNYYWLDYSDAKIFVAQSFYHEEDGIAKNHLTDLFFTKEIEGKAEVISHLVYSDVLEEYFEGYAVPRLQEFEWYQIFKAASKDKKKHFKGNG